MPLSRRDRAALTLALECIRVTPGHGGGAVIARESALDALRLGRSLSLPAAIVFAVGESASAMVQAMADAGDCSSGDERYRKALGRNRRLLRARLALLLRAVLRVDAGDFGRRRCWWCGAPRGVPFPDIILCIRCGRGRMECDRIRPLWESARPHR